MNRTELREAHASTTRADVAFALIVAENADEVDQAAHLSLALFDVAGTFNTFDEHNRTWPALHDLVVDARTRVRGFHGNAAETTSWALDALAEKAKSRRRADWLEQEARIQRLGFASAKSKR